MPFVSVLANKYTSYETFQSTGGIISEVEEVA